MKVKVYIRDLLKELFEHHDFTQFEQSLISLLFRRFFPEREYLLKEMLRSTLERAADPQMLEIQFPITHEANSQHLNQLVYAAIYQHNVAPLQAEVLHGCGWCYIRAYTVDGSDLDPKSYFLDNVEYEFDYVRKRAEEIIQTHPVYCTNLEEFDGFKENKQKFEQILEKSKIITDTSSSSFVEYNDERNSLFTALIGSDDADEYRVRLLFDSNNGFFYLDVIKMALNEKFDSCLALSDLERYEICARYPNSQLVGKLRTNLYEAGYESLDYSFLVKEIKELQIGMDSSLTVFDFFFGIKL